MEKKVVTEKREVLRYVADDGTEFKNEKDCQNYETRINRENLLAALEKIERADLNMAPPGTSYVDTERYSYVWFRPQNRQEINTINAYFGTTTITIIQVIAGHLITERVTWLPKSFLKLLVTRYL